MTVILKQNDLCILKNKKAEQICSALISKKKINYCLVTVVTEISPDV